MRLPDPVLGHMLVVECDDPLATATFDGSDILMADATKAKAHIMVSRVVCHDPQSKAVFNKKEAVVWHRKGEADSIMIGGKQYGYLHESRVISWLEASEAIGVKLNQKTAGEVADAERKAQLEAMNEFNAEMARRRLAQSSGIQVVQ